MSQNNVRWMVIADYPSVVRIDACSFLQPWGIADFSRELRQRNSIGRVMLLGGRVVAYMVYRLHPRAFEIARFAVDPDFRRLHLGCQLVDTIKWKLGATGRDRIVIDVPERMLDTQLFLRSLNFRCYAVDRGGCGEDDVFRFEYRMESGSHLTGSIVGDSSNQNT